MEDWKSLYETYRALWNRFSKSHENQQIGRQVLVRALNPTRSYSQVEREINSFALPVDLAAVWSDIEPIRNAYDELAEWTFSLDSPASSVYQVAIQIIKQQLPDEVDREGGKRWFYRGQRRSEWSTLASIFRNIDAGREEYLLRLENVRKVVRALGPLFPDKSQLERLAIAQHYSNVLNISTWLVDVTTSPFIGLFFASDGGQEGDVGVLYYIERTEWESFSGEGTSQLGSLRYVSPTGIPRIENQRAFFIDSVRPELFRQLSNRSYYFYQQPGVVFEDESLDPPVVRDKIYPQKDPILERLPDCWDNSQATPLESEPSWDSIQQVDSDAFAAIVGPWIADASIPKKLALQSLIRLHTEVTRRQSNLPHYIGTLHHLRRGVESINSGVDPDFFLEFYYLSHIRTPNEADAMLACIAIAFPESISFARSELSKKIELN